MYIVTQHSQVTEYSSCFSTLSVFFVIGFLPRKVWNIYVVFSFEAYILENVN